MDCVAYQMYGPNEILFLGLCGQHVRIGAMIIAGRKMEPLWSPSNMERIYGVNCPIT